MRIAAITAVLLLATASCREQGSADVDDSTSGESTASSTAAEETGDIEWPTRPDTQPCRFDGAAPGLLPPLELVPVLADATLVEPVDVVAAADDSTVLVAERDGRILAGRLDTGTLAPVVDLGDRGQLVALAPAPDFAASGHLFVRYEATAGAPRGVVARVTVDPATGTSDPATLRVVMEIADAIGERSGGALVFDATGMLVIGVGDLGDESGTPQDPLQRAGKILRIDVSTLDDTGAYAIPADNPYKDLGGSADEVWATGLRDPWRCSVASDATLWCVDRGELEHEVDRVEVRADLGWPQIEGGTCRLAGGDCSDLAVAPPTATYRMGDGDCGIAGVQLVADPDEPGLADALVFADRCSGRLRGLDTASAEGVLQDEILLDEPAGIVSLGVDRRGGLLAITGDARITRVRAAVSDAAFPVRLSDSGCFADLPALAPVASVVPYGVNAELWSDGAIKQRFIALPPQTTIEADVDGSLQFPLGTVLLKTFSFEFVAGDPSSRRPVETRAMVLREYGWQFHSYRWDDDGRDAQLLTSGALDTLVLDDRGERIELEYTWPNRGNCKVCHGLGSSSALGPRLDQLDGEYDYGFAVANQITALQELELLEPVPAMVPRIPAVDDPDASLEARARGWLHTNCAHCHRPGGWTPPELTMDLRWTTAFADTHTCGVEMQYYNAWVTGTVRIVAGDPEASVIWQRLHTRGLGQMPPLATRRSDPKASVVRDWIASLADCP